MPDASASDSQRPPRMCILGAFVFQIAALIIVGWINRHALNPDAVAYLRIASYYAEGKMTLAVSDYWSPLISWILVPFLKMGMSPLPAGRVFMGLSAIAFLVASLQIFRRFGLSKRFFCWGLWISAIVSIPWSVENITPDLLMAALVCFSFAMMTSDNWPGRKLVPFICGICWGVAYLCKAIALPMALLTSLGVAFLWRRKRPDAGRTILQSFILTILGTVLISAPWIAIISSKTGKLTLSTSATLNHSLVGPYVAKQVYLLDQGFAKPEAGRITRWENPTPPYSDWSPFSSLENAIQQARIILMNIPIVLIMLTSVCLGFPFLILAGIKHCRRKRLFADSFRVWWAFLPVVALAILYLPNYLLVYEQRYFYVTFPFFIVLISTLFSGEVWLFRFRLNRYGGLLLALAMLLPTFARDWIRPGTTHEAGDCAHVLAGKIRAASMSGPIAGSGKLPGGRTGLYLGFLLDEPWYGDKPAATAADFKMSGASLVVVNRRSGAAQELEVSTDFTDLDGQLFDSMTEANGFPLHVFRRRPASVDGLQ